MDQIIVAFITGLTTGGLSCLAVQGGLLATSLAAQIEQDMLSQAQAMPGRGKRQGETLSRHALPILLFLLSKLAAYTLLGALLGLVGSLLTFSPVMRALLLFAIGVFMIGNGLRLLNVHPFFRIFSIEPPRFITRYLRRRAKHGTDLATPLFLGALTVFIPCGVTQAMMAVALGTGSALAGAALMFAFTLGTSPVFFLVAYFTAQLGRRLERFFMRFVAVVVLVLGLVTVDSGLNLIGSPLSFSHLSRSVFAPQTTGTPAASSVTEDGVLELQVANNGYFPKTLYAPANTSLTLALVTENTTSCARDFVIPALDYYQLLPSSGITTTEIPPQEAGSILRFTCSMGMYTGQIVFDQ